MKQRLLNPQAARQVIAGLLLLFMTLPMMAQGQSPVIWSGNVADQIANKNGATGEEGSPILIENGEELAYLAQQTNAKGALKVGNTNFTYNKEYGKQFGYNICFALGADIDLNGHDWTPIGTGDMNPFNSHFDGKGYCISGLRVNLTEGSDFNAGLFGLIYKEAIIQNLGVKLHKKGVRATSEGVDKLLNAGGIVGILFNGGTIRNCYVDGPGAVVATGGGHVKAGGIAGSSKMGVISHCYTTVDVKAGGGSSENHAGGIVGYSYDGSSLSYTYATGSVEATGTGATAGGICGLFSTTFTNHLALNKEVKGDGKNIHRVAGFNSNGAASHNYASPETYVNGEPVSSKDASSKNGSDEKIDLTNYATTLKADPANEWDDAWDFDGNGLLPQLQMVTGENQNGSPSTYGKWNSNSPQPQLRAGNHMGVTKIKNDGDGNGDSWANAIKIANSAELKYLGKMVNTKGNLTVGSETIENNGTGFEGIYFILTDNIDLSAYHWEPIGITPIENKCFRGHFDGNGYCVSGLSVGYGSEQYIYAGLFGYVQNGSIQNLGVKLAENGGIWGSYSAGGIVGCIRGSKSFPATLRNCYVEGPGRVMSKGNNYNYNYAGGIAGSTEGTNTILSHCYSTVDVEASGVDANLAGGIVGHGTGNISYTYATGSIQASGNGNNRVGGICGYVNSNTTLSNNLALNKEIKGNGEDIHRVAGYVSPRNSNLTDNYASLQIPVNSASVYNQDLTSLDGSDDIHIDDYEKALKTEVDEDKQPWVFGSINHLPKLKMLISNDPDNPEYAAWPNEKQPTLSPDNYLPAKFTLHIVAPNGGSVTVKDGADNEILDNAVVIAGTPLTLSQSANDNYDFVGFLSGTGQNSLSNCDATLTMPKSELWVSAQFKEKPKPEPEPEPVPVYHTVTLPAVEGATTSPGPGDHEVESWDNFRFYLTLDPAYSESQPIVTTSRGETIQPRISDGAYLVKYVRTDVQIFIDGIQPNTPTANAAIEADALRIYALGSTLVISAPRTAEAMLCDLSGRLLDTYQLAPGQTRIEGLRAGIYIVKVPGFEGVKVVIR